MAHDKEIEHNLRQDVAGTPTDKAVASESAVGFKTVCSDELHEVIHRRETLGQESDPQKVKSSLVGLALSGGGIRAASMALGVMQSLYARNILPYVDYLSTVSGGGYAGAYLTSSTLKAGHRKRQSKKSDSDRRSEEGNAREQGEESEDELFPIAPTSTGKPSARMLRFMNGGNYLRRTWVFFNRYLIGLLLLWSVVFSGLVAATSFTAWAFRSLDHTASRAWIYALGFDDEVMLAFFPSCVLLGIWAILWAISYFKYGARSRGGIARAVFFALVFATLVATAALFGNGQWAGPDPNGSADLKQIKSLTDSMYKVVLIAIAVSLVPYLRPKKLVQSGTNPKNTTERYVFWIATRALVFGVPFIFVAYFARENISGWNEHRDDRITRAELGSMDYLSSPLWRQVAATQVPQDDPSHQPVVFGNLWRPENTDDKSDLEILAKLFRRFQEEDLNKKLSSSDIDDIEAIKKKRSALSQTLEDSEAAWKSQLASDPDALANERDHLQAHLTESDSLKASELTLAARWWHLIKYFGEYLVGDEDNRQENPIYRLANQYIKERNIKWKISRLLNKRLEDPTLYNTLLPKQPFERAMQLVDDKKIIGEARTLHHSFVSVRHSISDTSFQEWCVQLRDQRERIANSQLTLVSPNNPSNNSQPSAAQRGLDRHLFTTETMESATAISNEERIRLTISENRKLLEAFFGRKEIEPKQIVWSSVVLAKDQETRINCVFYSLIVFVIAGLCIDLNATSWHGFYSKQIGQAWIESIPGLRNGLPLARMETTDLGRPYHLINASAHLIGRKQYERTPRRQSFLFSKLYCGSNDLGFDPTEDYMNGEYSLENAVAVSGAAVSPVETTNPLVIALLVLFNVRLGQWVANPGCPRSRNLIWQYCRDHWPITPFRVLLSMFGYVEKRPTCFLADGGHHENLGIEPLLARRCRLIIAIDAGADEQSEFTDLTKLFRIARIYHGISFERLDKPDTPVDLSPLIPTEPEKNKEQKDEESNREKPEPDPMKWSNSHFLVFRIKYAPSKDHSVDEGFLIYMKSTLTGDEPLELRQFRKVETEFPHSSTADQFYDPVRFDAYVQLGHHIADQIGNEIDLSDQTLPAREFINQMVPEAKLDD